MNRLTFTLALAPYRIRVTWLRWRNRRLARRAARLAVQRAFAETKHLPPCLR